MGRHIDTDDVIYVAFAITPDSLLWPGDFKLLKTMEKRL